MSDRIPKPVVLAVMDGWGWNPRPLGNPIAQANTPTIDMLSREYPSALLQASGSAVGMEWSETGNSEVGHLTMGSGRIIDQYNSRINKTIANGQFYTNEALLGAFKHARENNSAVNIIGLLTSGTVHASLDHLDALLEMAARVNYEKTFIHLFLDGHDSGLNEGIPLLNKLQEIITRTQHGMVASIIGRDFSMDKNNDWNKTKKAYDLLASAAGEKTNDPISKIKGFYSAGMADYSVLPIINEPAKFAGIQNGDALIFFNFREDGIRQIVKPFVMDDFDIFEPKNIENLYVASMTRYLDTSKLKVAFEPPTVINTLAEVLSTNNKTQFHIAETIKYAHVTYFFNGIKSTAIKGETDAFIESPKILLNNPAMGSQEIANRVADEISKGYYDFIVVNFANPDMLAHTGNFDVTKRGIEWVDKAIQHLHDIVLSKDAVMILTADHGNAESMLVKGSGEAKSKHNPSPVPIYLIDKRYKNSRPGLRAETVGILADIAPTILELMRLPQPPEMTGRSLLPELTQQ
ncbi:MAG: 2,3-bisphosphoglycerate-independent phosphoglycerate mutase [bacterium]|nr:2,3-bisphosphoglycerate-independent phosphoglycerate mutase [bacterium]